MLDGVQALAHAPEVIVVIDGSGSGSFVGPLAPGANQQRLVLTSAAADECGVFLAEPAVTYTHKLLAPLWSGVTYAAAHDSATNFFTNFVGNYAGTRLNPQLQDGVGGTLARSRWLGRRYAFAGDEASGLPFVLEAEVEAPGSPGERPRLRARLMEGVEPANDGGPDPLDSYRVFASVTPRGLVCSASTTSIPRIRLRRESATGWTWSAPVSELIEPGVYPVTFVAEYDDTAELTRESTPVSRACGSSRSR